MNALPPSAPQQAWSALQDLKISNLHIEVVGDCFYLYGLAGCYKTKQIAARVVEAAVPGVCVVNELRVAQPPSTNEDVARAVGSAIARVASAATARISVDVHAGVVMLSGEASSDDERCAVEAAAWEAPGVVQVQSHLTVAQAATDEEIARLLNDYVGRAMNVPRDAIVVTYRRGVASLSGRAASIEQRQAIEDLVRWHDRVTDVENNLLVVKQPEVRATRMVEQGGIRS